MRSSTNKIRSNDADVVVLAISVANTIQADELWIAYGSGKHLHNLPAHSIATSLGPEKSSALPMFHALTGCNTVSFFGGRGKKERMGCVESIFGTDTSAQIPHRIT